MLLQVKPVRSAKGEHLTRSCGVRNLRVPQGTGLRHRQSTVSPLQGTIGKSYWYNTQKASQDFQLAMVLPGRSIQPACCIKPKPKHKPISVEGRLSFVMYIVHSPSNAIIQSQVTTPSPFPPAASGLTSSSSPAFSSTNLRSLR